MTKLENNKCIWDAAKEPSRNMGPNFRSSQDRADISLKYSQLFALSFNST